mmetsp:Transcript_23554/g.77507  ORF Transcript_23554/g.77507 Transcript_23554/m.77507 type:complete len:217 (-) Transcript_23554:503-1153(-)
MASSRSSKIAPLRILWSVFAVFFMPDAAKNAFTRISATVASLNSRSASARGVRWRVANFVSAHAPLPKPRNTTFVFGSLGSRFEFLRWINSCSMTVACMLLLTAPDAVFARMPAGQCVFGSPGSPTRTASPRAPRRESSGVTQRSSVSSVMKKSGATTSRKRTGAPRGAVGRPMAAPDASAASVCSRYVAAARASASGSSGPWSTRNVATTPVCTW